MQRRNLVRPENQSGIVQTVHDVLRRRTHYPNVIVVTDALGVIPFDFVHRGTLVEVNPERGTGAPLIIAIAYRTTPTQFGAFLLVEGTEGVLVAPRRTQ